MPDGFIDIVGAFAQRDVCLVLPSLEHAVWWWPEYQECIARRHGIDWINFTKTNIISKKTHTSLRLWVPYSLDPTMPMDFIHAHVFRVEYMSTYYTGRELHEVARVVH